MLATAAFAVIWPNIARSQTGMLAGPTQASGILSPLLGAGEANPGWLYYGINAADRGLGYRGSYMTLGGFIPYAQDDLGGFWSADLRGHLSVYGGFFSNVGLVRKQFIGGTVLGIGVYWDYDGDQNQYADTTITDASGSYVFAGGETYQQVGISGEWLTDWGNLRSNGYIPAGSTGSTMGPFVGNSILCVNGINAALGGADLEVGAYIPGLADWAGMISVGGYAYGNSRYQFPGGADVVPWFGGVYTRLDMTFIENWDFSLQANNDSYFDWTGFARLTYRLGSSRRRNVPDQIEQPMMRNEHIVRAHQAPVQAVNPRTGNPWQIFHVDNTAVGGGNGTAATPFNELTDAQAAAASEFDIVFLHVGDSPSNPYVMRDPIGDPIPYTFQASNQFLVGEGSSLLLDTTNCGQISLSRTGNSGAYPVMSNPLGAAVVLTDSSDPLVPGTTANATVDHLQIVGSQVGISDGGGLPASAPGAPGRATVNDVRIAGTGLNQRGVEIQDLGGNGGRFDFTNMQLINLTNDGFFVDGSFGSPRVNIEDSSIRNTTGSAVYATNLFAPGRVRVARANVTNTTGPAFFAKDAELSVASSMIRGGGSAGVYAEDSSVVQVVDSTIIGSSIGVHGTASAAGAQLYITINDNVIVPKQPGNGVVLSTPSPANTAEVYAYVIGNQIRAAGDDILLFDGSPAGLPGTAELYLKAADATDLRNLNRNASVREVFPLSPTPTVPAPPNYDPSLVVPLPSP